MFIRRKTRGSLSASEDFQFWLTRLRLQHRSWDRRGHSTCNSQAQVDVANARMVGRIGEAEKEGETKQQIAKINARTAVAETERKVEKANADQKLRTREIEIAKELNLEQIAAERAAQERDAELQKGVEEKRAQMELEKQRATHVVNAKIARESSQEKADQSGLDHQDSVFEHKSASSHHPANAIIQTSQ